MAISMYRVDSDVRIFWIQRLKRGQVSKPEYAYVPVEEKYNMNAPGNVLRELFGRHRCPACGKAFFLRESAFDCHPAASACKVWEKFAHTGPAGSSSLGDSIRAGIASGFYGSCGYYGGGPFGL